MPRFFSSQKWLLISDLCNFSQLALGHIKYLTVMGSSKLIVMQDLAEGILVNIARFQLGLLSISDGDGDGEGMGMHKNGNRKSHLQSLSISISDRDGNGDAKWGWG